MEWDGPELQARAGPEAAERSPLAPRPPLPPAERRARARALLYEDVPLALDPDDWDGDDKEEEQREEKEEAEDEEEGDEGVDAADDPGRWQMLKETLQSTWVYTLVQFVVVLTMQLLTRACLNSFLHSR